MKGQCYHFLLRKAHSVIGDSTFRLLLALSILDLRSYFDVQSLQTLCLKFIAKNEHQYQPNSLESLLPQHLLKKKDLIFLSQQLIGEWAGDRLIITGDYSEYSPFPPNGEWKEGNLFNLAYECFSNLHINQIYKHYIANTDNIQTKLKKFFDGKVLVVVNLDKKEYLDPQKYPHKKIELINNFDFNINDEALGFEGHNWRGVMTGLVIALIHSTGCGTGDLCSSVSSQGSWAGDRIAITTPEQLDDFDSYQDVSNQADLERLA